MPLHYHITDFFLISTFLNSPCYSSLSLYPALYLKSKALHLNPRKFKSKVLVVLVLVISCSAVRLSLAQWRSIPTVTKVLCSPWALYLQALQEPGKTCVRNSWAVIVKAQSTTPKCSRKLLRGKMAIAWRGKLTGGGILGLARKRSDLPQPSTLPRVGCHEPACEGRRFPSPGKSLSGL